VIIGRLAYLQTRGIDGIHGVDGFLVSRLPTSNKVMRLIMIHRTLDYFRITSE